MKYVIQHPLLALRNPLGFPVAVVIADSPAQAVEHCFSENIQKKYGFIPEYAVSLRLAPYPGVWIGAIPDTDVHGDVVVVRQND